MLGRLGFCARIALRVVPASPSFLRPGISVGLRLAPLSNVPAQGSGSRDLPTPWAPKHPQLGKSPQDMINEVPVIMVSGDRVSCDGGTDPRLGHPRVYLNLHKGDPVSCSYCGLRHFHHQRMVYSYQKSKDHHH